MIILKIFKVCFYPFFTNFQDTATLCFCVMLSFSSNILAVEDVVRTTPLTDLPQARSFHGEFDVSTLISQHDVEVIQDLEVVVQTSIFTRMTNPSVALHNWRQHIIDDYGDRSCCTGTVRQFVEGDKRIMKVCACRSSCCILLVTLPILLGCLLPTYTQHIHNTTRFDLLVNCPGSSRTLHAGEQGRLYCSSKPTSATLCATAPAHDVIEGTCATGRDVKHTNVFELSLGSCNTLENRCSSYCNGNYGDDSNEWITWTPVDNSASQNVTQSVVPAWNSKNLGYISDVAEKLGKLRGTKK